MSTDSFPVLKPDVRIKKLPDRCWLLHLRSDENCELKPIQAFVFSLCTGEWTIDELSVIVGRMFGVSSADCRKDIAAMMDTHAGCFLQADSRGAVQHRYDPATFLYDPHPGVLAGTDRFDTPGELTLSLTHACNFRCIYCFNASGKRNGDELRPEQWISLVDQASDLGVQQCTVTGGEPLMYPGLDRILSELAEKDIVTCVCTNGSLVNGNVVSLFRDTGVDVVQVSLDSGEESVHERLSGTTGTFGAVVSALELLVAEGLYVCVKAVLTPYNCRSVGELIRVCAGAGVKKLVLDRFDVSSCGRGSTDLLISGRDMDGVREQVSEFLSAGSSELVIKKAFRPQQWNGEDDVVPCASLRKACTIVPNGNISVCEKILNMPEMTAGNICVRSLKDIWNDPRTTAIINPPAERLSSECRSCSMLQTCGTGCFAVKCFLHEDPYTTDPRCWKASKTHNPYAKLQ